MFFEIFHMIVSYPKTLTKTGLKHIMTFCTLNGHILLIKYNSYDERDLW